MFDNIFPVRCVEELDTTISTFSALVQPRLVSTWVSIVIIVMIVTLSSDSHSTKTIENRKRLEVRRSTKNQCCKRSIHGIMGRRFPDGGLLRYRKWVAQQLGDVNKQGSGDSRLMGARHGSQSQLYSFFGVVDRTLTHFFWSTGWGHLVEVTDNWRKSTGCP